MNEKMKFKGQPPMGAGLPGGPQAGGPMEMPEADISMMKNYKLDIRYSDAHERCVFDIYYPEGKGPFPVLLHMHGGGFAMGDKRDFHIQQLLKFTEYGYAFASCNYRRSGNAPFPAAVLDCRRFVDYLHAHAEELGIDADRMCAYGGSAGGNLSALFAMNIEKFPGEQDKVDASVACAVDWFGPTDFSAMDRQARENGISLTDHDTPESPESMYLGTIVSRADKALIAAANPITYISDAMRPLLLQHGTGDVLVPFAQSVILKEAIESKLGPGRVTFIPLKGAGHDDDMFKSPENLTILKAFLDWNLKGIRSTVPLEQMPLPRQGGGAAGAHFGLPAGGPAGGPPPMGGKPPFGGPGPMGMPPMGGKTPDMGPGGPSRQANTPPDGFEPPFLAQEILDSIPAKYLDIPYGSQSESQKLDLYLPDESYPRPCPVIVHFHGGAFMMCTKRDDSVEPMLRGRERGYALVSAEYRKSGEARFPAMVYDAKTVIRWVRANAEKYGLDASRIAVWGPSSGGWLSSYVAVTNGNPAFEDLSQGYEGYSSEVQACVDWCGPCGDFLNMDPAFRRSGLGIPDHNEPISPESLFLGHTITEIPELCRLASPIALVTPDVVPFLILHGGADQVVPTEQSIAFAEKINSVAGAGKARLHVVPGKPHHGDPWYHEPWVSAECLDFLDEVLK